MSKRSKARDEEMIRSMEGLAVLKPAQAKLDRPTKAELITNRINKVMVGVIAGIILASTAIWLLR